MTVAGRELDVAWRRRHPGAAAAEARRIEDRDGAEQLRGQAIEVPRVGARAARGGRVPRGRPGRLRRVRRRAPDRHRARCAAAALGRRAWRSSARAREPLLVPLVGDAVRSIDVGGRGGVDLDSWPIRSMQIDVFTLFPEWFGWFSASATSRNALRLGHDLRLFNYRDTTPLPRGPGRRHSLRRRRRDGDPRRCRGRGAAGGLRPRHRGDAGRAPGGVLAPAGRPLDDALAEELAGLEALTLLCGRYEGIDERVREHLANDAISIGPLRAVRRRAGGDGGRRRGAAQAAGRARPRGQRASRSPSPQALEGAPEYPHYTRPASLPGLGGARRAALRAPRESAVARRWRPRARARRRRAGAAGTVPGSLTSRAPATVRRSPPARTRRPPHR